MIEGLFNHVAAPVIAGLIRLLAATLRIRIRGREQWLAGSEKGRPCIIPFWHEDLLDIALAKLRLRPKGQVAVMVSRSRDGERLARVIRYLGLVPVRASSSRGAVRGLIEMRRFLATPAAHAQIVAIALDGPRGPRRTAKLGAAMLARATGAPVLPVSFDPRPRKEFHSWDQTRLPFPFARFEVLFGPLLEPADWADDDAANTVQITRHLPPPEQSRPGRKPLVS